MRERSDKASGGKRRRKHGNYVRSQQPLWATIAASKAMILREYESSQAANEARDADATDLRNLGSRSFPREPDKVWITQVNPGSFFFETSALASSSASEPHGKPTMAGAEESGIDRTKALYVRINGTDWAFTKIHAIPDSLDQRGRRQWAGEVYGLTPASAYQVAFIRSGDDHIIHSEKLATPPPPAAEQGKVQLANGRHGDVLMRS
jgi:ubiquitination network signaling protein AcrB